MSIPAASQTGLVGALTSLRDVLARTTFPLETPSTAHAVDVLTDSLHQLDDYILPRITNLYAPLVAVVGGSTGSGKSTLVNSILGENIAKASAIRPTTRRPLLVHAQDDTHWFEDGRILPGLTRVFGEPDGEESHTEIELAESSQLPTGLALLDSPDIDSVVEENRHLASELLAAADLWLFVTSAARYADAIPWNMLSEAVERDVVVAVVLNRVPQGVGAQVRSDLAHRLDEHGLGHAPLFVISERLDDEDRIPEADVVPIVGWLTGLAHDAAARASVARQTLLGAIGGLAADGKTILSAIEEQRETVRAMRADIAKADGVACGSVVASLADGRVLRSEVLERWNEVVESGVRMRRLEGGVARMRGRITGWFRGEQKASSGAKVEEGIMSSLSAIFVAEAQGAVHSVDDAWRSRPGARDVREEALAAVRGSEARTRRADAAVGDWSHALTEIVGTKGKDKRATAKLDSVGADVVKAALMIVVFSSTAGLASGESAGGRTAERLLEAIFGGDAVKSMARRAREDLLERAASFFAEELVPFRQACERVAISTELRNDVNRSFGRIERLYAREGRR